MRAATFSQLSFFSKLGLAVAVAGAVSHAGSFEAVAQEPPVPSPACLLESWAPPNPALQPAEMLRACDRALAGGSLNTSDRTRIFMLRAEARLRLSQVDAAVADITAALRLEPSNWRARCLRARIHLAQGPASAAFTELRKLQSERPNDKDTSLLLSVAFGKLGRLPESIAAASQAIHADPDDGAAYAVRAQTYMAQGHPEKARPDITHALELGLPAISDAPETLYDLAGRVFSALGQHDRALKYYLIANRLQPKDFAARYGLWRENFAMAKYNVARYLSGRLVRDFPREADAHLAAARSALALGETREATAEAKGAISFDPRNADALALLGDVDWTRGEVSAAAGWYRDALAKDPGCVAALIGAASMILVKPNLSNEDRDQALRMAQRACRLTRRRDPSALLTLASCEAAAGDLDTAERDTKAALACVGENLDVREACRRLLRGIESHRKDRSSGAQGGGTQGR